MEIAIGKIVEGILKTYEPNAEYLSMKNVVLWDITQYDSSCKSQTA
jgi:hypothetical protein